MVSVFGFGFDSILMEVVSIEGNRLSDREMIKLNINEVFLCLKAKYLSTMPLNYPMEKQLDYWNRSLWHKSFRL